VIKSWKECILTKFENRVNEGMTPQHRKSASGDESLYNFH